MNDDHTYYKSPVERVLELLQARFKDQFRGYFNGLMDDIPESLLPCIMASTTEGHITAANTAQDRIDETVAIIVAINKKDYIGPEGETNLADLHLRHLVMGQDPEAVTYLPQTVMHVLRTNFTLEYGVVDNNFQFEFAPNQRGEKIFTQEAFLTLTVRRNLLVPRQ